MTASHFAILAGSSDAYTTKSAARSRPTMPAAGAVSKRMAAFGEVAAGLDAAGLVVEGLVVVEAEDPDDAEETDEAADELEALLVEDADEALLDADELLDPEALLDALLLLLLLLPVAEPVEDEEPDDAEFLPTQLVSEPD